ncbi:hypothetical protein Mmc1_2367 [Magnetococcus marinus MC-1]|uniref:Uncharacterized protein n=1 Tax=Magnetococcus marinus (strain ATCC BAA-1437 / JCM 17883 / MC-1) TaxID=156889 RepID=A0LA74_MAGMM|nr:hypothetical protein [Magnetococcus marinus]ABK44867.1 hypothetical protein Mmc1_2367 [Magnetococcus marinus MC-1]
MPLLPTNGSLLTTLHTLQQQLQTGSLSVAQQNALLPELLGTLLESQQQIEQLRKTLLQIPHGNGDHSDYCRMQNNGLAPKQGEHCHCHVKAIQETLQQCPPA